jgi:hypothetical protein
MARCAAGLSDVSVYSRADRLLHHVALGFRPLLEVSFDIERALHGKAAAELPAPAPVFVTGLARAGTTILMRVLHGTGRFAALSYRDLPFPLAPNAWSRSSAGSRRALPTRERGHGDGLTHDLDSPEAIEEVFWLGKEGPRYRLPRGLAPVVPQPESIEDFCDYVRLVLLRYGKPRYLSKNNNNLLRLPALVQAFPDARLLHPFRDPLQQAASLRDQHRRACALAAQDPFRARFMHWLGHHEFGAGQRPFLLPGAPPADADRDGLDYWLQLWTSVYSHLLEQPEAVTRRQLFVEYERLPVDSRRQAERLGRYLQLDVPIGFERFQLAPTRVPGVVNPQLYEQACEVHARLCRRALAAREAPEASASAA